MTTTLMAADRLATPVLGDGDVADFHRDGYVVLRGGLGAADMKRIERWTRELAEFPEEAGKHWVYHEKSLLDPATELIGRIENIAPFHAGFAELTRVLKEPVTRLLGEDAVLFKEKLNFKMPGGGGFKMHQDSQAGWWDYADFFLTVMVCVDEATLDNGCLKMVAGHHKRGLLREWEPLTDEDMNIFGEEAKEAFKKKKFNQLIKIIELLDYRVFANEKFTSSIAYTAVEDALK